MMSIASLIHRGQRPWIFIAAVVFLVVMGLGVVMGPVRNRFLALDESIVVQEKKAARNLRVLSPASKDAAISEYQAFGNAIPRRGSSAEETAAMLAELEKHALELGVVTTATKQREPKLEKDFEEYQVEIEIEANMKQLVSFLYGIESSSQLLRVDRLALESKGSSERGSFRGSLLVSKVVTM